MMTRGVFLNHFQWVSACRVHTPRPVGANCRGKGRDFLDRLSDSYPNNVRYFNTLLGVGRSCDLVSRDFRIGGRAARIYVVDGYGRDPILERMAALWLQISPESLDRLSDMQDFVDQFVSFSEVTVTDDTQELATSVLAGKTLLLMEGLSGGALIDAKELPGRSVGEPMDGKVLRGPHDGFVEAIVPNMALLRRRIRDPHLTMEGHKVGRRSQTDVVLCYLSDRADASLLRSLRERLDHADINALTMSQESLAEVLRPGQWYNPFPKARYTERPDSAAACVLEGNVVILVDNSPSAMLLPTCFLDFTQETNEYYFPPLLGTYFRLLRLVVFLLSLFITPLWYLLVSQPGRLPSALSFLHNPSLAGPTLLSQLLAVEFLIDVLKLASLNTPASLSNSFSMLGALVLGDFAVQSGWLGPEVLVHMAFVSVAAFTQPSYEMGYAFKLLRIGLLLLTALLDFWGFLLGVGAMLVLLVTVKPLAGKGYLYPLIPFNGTALKRLLFRVPIHRDNT